MTSRTVLIVLLVAACKKHAAKPAAGAGSGSATVAPLADAAPRPSIDAAPPPATFDMSIRSDGVGPITATTDPKTLGQLFPGTTVDTSHEDTYTVANNGANLVSVYQDHDDPTRPLYVTILSSAFATKEGFRIGTTVADFVGKDAAGDCKRATYHVGDETVHTFECTTPNLPNVKLMLDETKPSNQGEPGKVIAAKIAGERFVRIVWFNPGATIKSPLAE